MYTHHAIVDTRLGEVTLVASDDSMVGLYFPHHWYKPADDTFGAPVNASTDVLLAAARSQLDDYLGGVRTSFDLPTATHGDPFEERVWALLNEIPFGETTTYGSLAWQLGDTSLAPSVGQAVGRNPLCVIVPCHRVIGTDGKLTGYAGGLTRKQFLLDLEAPAIVKAGKLV